MVKSPARTARLLARRAASVTARKTGIRSARLGRRTASASSVRGVAPSADVEPGAQVGDGTRIWPLAQVRAGARVGRDCVLGRGAYVGPGAVVGDRSKLRNHALVYEPAVLEDGVFVGPAVVLTNDSYPRAVTPEGRLQDADDWTAVGVTVREGASIGARAVCVAPVTIGRWSLVAGRGRGGRRPRRARLRPRGRRSRYLPPLGRPRRRTPCAGPRRGAHVAPDRPRLRGGGRRPARGAGAQATVALRLPLLPPDLQFVYNDGMASDTTTVRVRRPDSERLQSLAKSRQTAVIDVLHAAIDALERQEFLRGLNQDYQRLRDDPERWEQYAAERQEWDALA